MVAISDPLYEYTIVKLSTIRRLETLETHMRCLPGCVSKLTINTEYNEIGTVRERGENVSL